MNPSSRAVAGSSFARIVVVVVVTLATAFSVSAGRTQGSGAFVVETDRVAVSPWTPEEMRSFLPERGRFIFPAPYGTEGIRVTNASDCGGSDCVEPVGGASWRNIDAHVGRDHMFIFLGLRGAGPTLFRYDKRTERTENVGPLFEAGSPFATRSGEGWYFSARRPATLYVTSGAELLRYDVLARTFETVLDATTEFGERREIGAAYSSDDDNVHSATLRDTESGALLGCLAYREDLRRISYHPASAALDGCEVDKSGRWLVIKENADGDAGVDNRIVDLESGAETLIPGQDGAGGYSANGSGYVIAADNGKGRPGGVRVWSLDQDPPQGELVYDSGSADGIDVGAMAHSSAGPDVSLSQQFACAPVATAATPTPASEIVCFRLDASGEAWPLARSVGLPRGNLDVTGRYFLWVSRTGDRSDALMVKVPEQVAAGRRDGRVPNAGLTCPTSPVARGATFATTVTFGSSAADRVASYKPAAPNWRWVGSIKSVPLPRPATITMKAQDRVGNFQLRLLANNTYTVIGSCPYQVATTGDTAPPQVSGIVAGVAVTSATITWITDEPADTQIVYGTTTAYGSSTTLDPSLVLSHSQAMSGLTAGTLYHYRVKSRDAVGNLATSADLTFTTLVTPDTTPPSVSITAPAGGATVTGTIPVTANASDNVGVAGVLFKRNGVNIGVEDTTAPYSVSWNTVGLASGSYTLTAVARDAAGNTTTSAGVTVTVTNDTTPPTVSITAPAAGATVFGTVTVSANASDNVGVAGVLFKRNGVNIGVEDTTAPYSVSWNTVGLANGSYTLTAVARDAAGNTTTSSGVTVTVSNGGGGGIATQYPGDVGIEGHPDVVFVERFEDPTLPIIFARWTDILNGPAMLLSPDVPPGSPGTRSLNIPWVGGGVNNGGHLYKQLTPGVDDTLYVRYYVKYPTSGGFSHNGIWMGGYNPPLGWPNPQAGLKPVGNDRFSAAAELNSGNNRFDHYDYWMNMRQSGDGNYWGNLLLNSPAVVGNPGQWMCVEQMIKLNNPVTSFNGENAFWIGGVKKSHLGEGFPNGTWSGGIFTQTPGGTPFEGFRWRSDANLKLNYIWLQNYAPYDPPGFSASMFFDHVVVAKSYIGCLASGPPDTIPPVVSISSPLTGAIVSGTITVSANASDNVGVLGVRFKLDGANLGAEDLSAPYSVSWNTTTVPAGPHTLTAVARDAAGNSTTSTPVAVIVANPIGSWPNRPAGFTTVNDQPWNVMIGNGWSYLRRTGSKDDVILVDPTAPFTPLPDLQIIFTTDMAPDSEPGVHWMGLSSVKEVYTGWWMKISPNWSCSPAGCAKITFLHTPGQGQVYTGIYHQSGGPPYRIAANTEWAPYGQMIWYPNVTTTDIYPGTWHRIEFYYKWETSAGAADGIIRWWVDGTLNGNHVNVRYPVSAGFMQFEYAPTLQNPPPAEQYMYIDHTHVSKP